MSHLRNTFLSSCFKDIFFKIFKVLFSHWVLDLYGFYFCICWDDEMIMSFNIKKYIYWLFPTIVRYFCHLPSSYLHLCPFLTFYFDYFYLNYYSYVSWYMIGHIFQPCYPSSKLPWSFSVWFVISKLNLLSNYDWNWIEFFD